MNKESEARAEPANINYIKSPASPNLKGDPGERLASHPLDLRL